MREPAWYADWRDDALRELMAKQGEARKAFRVGEWERFDYEAESGTLLFSEGGVPRVAADIQIVGTTNTEDWLWSWANPHWQGCCVDEMHKVRDFGAENGIEELTTEYLAAEDLNHLGWEMTAVAARVLGAAGAYRPPQEDSAIFLLCKSFRFVS